MTITAKFATVCPCCKNRINAGDKVEWTKGQKARHVSCAASPASVSALSAPATRGARIEAQRRSWGAQRGMGAGHGQAAQVAGYSSYCTSRPGCGCIDCR